MTNTIYCGQCGNENPLVNKFCGSCGASINTLPNQLTKEPISNSNNVCPKCGLLDQIQKITSIIAGHTRHTSGVSITTSHSTLTGKQEIYAKDGTKIGRSSTEGSSESAATTMQSSFERTDLAKILSSPPPPPPPQEPNFGLVSKLLGHADEIPFKKQHYQEALRHHNIRMAHWRKSLEVWEQLYYCYRDDVVFVVGQQEYAEPSNLNAYVSFFGRTESDLAELKIVRLEEEVRELEMTYSQLYSQRKGRFLSSAKKDQIYREMNEILEYAKQKKVTIKDYKVLLKQ